MIEAGLKTGGYVLRRRAGFGRPGPPSWGPARTAAVGAGF
jgi:hypothetical protein